MSILFGSLSAMISEPISLSYLFQQMSTLFSFLIQLASRKELFVRFCISYLNESLFLWFDFYLLYSEC